MQKHLPHIRSSHLVKLSRPDILFIFLPGCLFSNEDVIFCDVDLK